jgi:hypothetical protein
MHKIKIDGKLYDFPNKLSEVTIEKFQNIIALKASESQSENIDLSIKIVSILMGVSEDFLNKIPYPDFIKLVQLSGFIFDSPSEEPKFEFVLNKQKYAMTQEISKMTTAEFIDLDTLVSDKDNAVENLHLILGILYRPINKKGVIEKYDSDKLEERAELFRKELTCDYAISAMLFSLALARVSTELILDSLKAEEQETNPMSESKKN